MQNLCPSQRADDDIEVFVGPYSDQQKQAIAAVLSELSRQHGADFAKDYAGQALQEYWRRAA